MAINEKKASSTTSKMSQTQTTNVDNNIDIGLLQSTFGNSGLSAEATEFFSRLIKDFSEELKSDFKDKLTLTNLADEYNAHAVVYEDNSKQSCIFLVPYEGLAAKGTVENINALVHKLYVKTSNIGITNLFKKYPNLDVIDIRILSAKDYTDKGYANTLKQSFKGNSIAGFENLNISSLRQAFNAHMKVDNDSYLEITYSDDLAAVKEHASRYGVTPHMDIGIVISLVKKSRSNITVQDNNPVVIGYVGAYVQHTYDTEYESRMNQLAAMPNTYGAEMPKRFSTSINISYCNSAWQNSTLYPLILTIGTNYIMKSNIDKHRGVVTALAPALINVKTNKLYGKDAEKASYEEIEMAYRQQVYDRPLISVDRTETSPNGPNDLRFINRDFHTEIMNRFFNVSDSNNTDLRNKTLFEYDDRSTADKLFGTFKWGRDGQSDMRSITTANLCKLRGFQQQHLHASFILPNPKDTLANLKKAVGNEDSNLMVVEVGSSHPINLDVATRLFDIIQREFTVSNVHTNNMYATAYNSHHIAATQWKNMNSNTPTSYAPTRRNGGGIF